MATTLRRSQGAQPVTTLELFYDLVFVFAITQVSHLLLGHLSWEGAGQAAIVLLVVWWSWNFTTWATNELDPESTPVRLLLLGLMLACLLMAIAIPEAFDDRALLFVGAYVAIQLGRHAFLAFAAAEAGTVERQRASRILAWFATAGVLWIAGALADGSARTVLWIAALAVDYGGPLALYWVPGGRRMDGGAWQVESGHFAERFQLFVIIALGESIVLTGATSSELDLDLARAAAIALAFAGSAALWWLYFASVSSIAEGTLERARDRTTVARDVYTYLHVVLVAGIVVSAVGDEVVIAHPSDELPSPQLIALVAGPALYLLAQALMRWRIDRSLSRSRLLGVLACGAIGLLGSATPALVVAALLALLLAAIVVLDERARRRRRGAADDELELSARD
ncbi:low temperature requirement protein A [Patulibacter defluvii]|uniref:low temperature requirement protein A n=1 Tax=Patulibacter defluvii TaxID=3095358 RepID=UPI002A7504BF|nr:low temperature requirement protein A [Patulibacter sp. DM4]